MEKIKKQKLERLLSKAANQNNGDRIRNIVDLMANKAHKYRLVGNLYLKKLIKDGNKYLAGAASSAYLINTGDTKPIADLEYGGLGYTKNILEMKNIKEFAVEMNFPEKIGGELVFKDKNGHFYNWDSGKKFPFPKEGYFFPQRYSPELIDKKLIFPSENRKAYYNVKTGRKVKQFKEIMLYPMNINNKLISQEFRSGNFYDWETGEKRGNFEQGCGRPIKKGDKWVVPSYDKKRFYDWEKGEKI